MADYLAKLIGHAAASVRVWNHELPLSLDFAFHFDQQGRDFSCNDCNFFYSVFLSLFKKKKP